MAGRTNVGQVSTAVVTLAGQSHSTASTNTTSVTVPAGMDALVICISAQDSNDANLPITGVTVNGSATGVVKAIETAGNPNDTLSSMWYKLAPSAGTYDVVVTSTGSVFKGVVCANVVGVVQQAPTVTSGTSGTAASVSLAISPTANFSLIIDCASHKGGFSSVSAGQTVIGVTETGQSFEHCTASYKVANAGATTMGQQYTSSNSYSDSAISFIPTPDIINRSAATGRSPATGRTIAT